MDEDVLTEDDVDYRPTLGDLDTAQNIWTTSMGGTYVLTPRNLRGEDPVAFAYYPEANVLLPLWHYAIGSMTPAAKSIPVRVHRMEGDVPRTRQGRPQATLQP